MLPESAPLARRLLQHISSMAAYRAGQRGSQPRLAVGGGGGLGLGVLSPGEAGAGMDILILAKQKDRLLPIINGFEHDKVFILDEEYYGSVTSEATRAFLTEKAWRPYLKAYFPFNTFRANAYLFGALLAQEAVAVNASLIGVRDEPMEVSFSLDGAGRPCCAVPWAGWIDEVREVLGVVGRTLGDLSEKAADLGISGERPGPGIIRGFGHDLEIFMKYAYGMGKAVGRRVLDIGGGLGYGALLLSRRARDVVFLDKSEYAVDFVKKSWVPMAPNLTAICGRAEDLGALEGYFETVFLMDVIEHVPDPERLLREAHHLLQPGGLLVASTPEEDYYPYRVCPVERRGEAPSRLLDDGIWPWHIQALGEERFLPMLREAGFAVEEKKYMTYRRGHELAERLSASRRARTPALLDVAQEITRWDITDFGLTDERDLVFSAASYMVTARKEG